MQAKRYSPNNFILQKIMSTAHVVVLWNFYCLIYWRRECRDDLSSSRTQLRVRMLWLDSFQILRTEPVHTKPWKALLYDSFKTNV